MKPPIDNTTIFNHYLIYPSITIYALSLTLKTQIAENITPVVSRFIPGIKNFSAATVFTEYALASWTLFWVTLPFLLASTLHLSIKAKAPRSIPSSKKLLLLPFSLILLVAVTAFLYYGPTPDPIPSGRISKIYSSNFAGFAVLGYSAWITFYASIYLALKSTAMTLYKGK